MIWLNFVRKRVVAGVLGLALVALCVAPEWAGASEARADAAVQDAPAVAAVGGAAAADAGRSCIPSEQCCKVCVKGKACGNTCIKAEYQCHRGRGCACDADEICE